MPAIDNPLDPRQDIISAALRAQQNMFNHSNVQLGKVVFGTASTPEWDGDNPSNQQVTAALAVPKFATKCAFIAETRFWGEGQWEIQGNGGWGSPALQLTSTIGVECGGFSNSDSGNILYMLGDTSLGKPEVGGTEGGWASTPTTQEIVGSSSSVSMFGAFDCSGQSAVNISGTLTGAHFVGCGVRSSILCLFQY